MRKIPNYLRNEEEIEYYKFKFGKKFNKFYEAIPCKFPHCEQVIYVLKSILRKNKKNNNELKRKYCGAHSKKDFDKFYNVRKLDSPEQIHAALFLLDFEHKHGHAFIKRHKKNVINLLVKYGKEIKIKG